jgi:arginine-tRNA-protein transferase
MPVRIVVDELISRRAQRRSWKRHQNLVATQHGLYYHPDHYALYLRYQARRHSGGGMDRDSREQYRHFLLPSNVNSSLVEFHEDGKLRMISIIDELHDGISSVYTFFDPDVQGASFGTYNILWQVQLCRLLKLPYLYLGYWIKESRKMAYKAGFRPLQGLVGGQWEPLSHSSIPED